MASKEGLDGSPGGGQQWWRGLLYSSTLKASTVESEQYRISSPSMPHPIKSHRPPLSLCSPPSYLLVPSSWQSSTLWAVRTCHDVLSEGQKPPTQVPRPVKVGLRLGSRTRTAFYGARSSYSQLQESEAIPMASSVGVEAQCLIRQSGVTISPASSQFRPVIGLDQLPPPIQKVTCPVTELLGGWDSKRGALIWGPIPWTHLLGSGRHGDGSAARWT